MPITVEQLPVPCYKLGEGPVWSEEDQALIYVSCFDKTVNRFFVNTNRLQVVEIDSEGDRISICIPVKDLPDHFIICVGCYIGLIKWSTSDPDQMSVKPTILSKDPEGFDFNDAKCDHQGRFWTGTVAPLDKFGIIKEKEAGTVCKLDSNLELSKWDNKISCSNGFAFSSDRKSCYYIDSFKVTVDEYDYNDIEGSIYNRKVAFDFASAGFGEHLPDGMCIDTDGNLWVACFRGSQVICVDPRENELLRQVTLPAKNITSCCFGGSEYDILYVTSAYVGHSAEEIANNSAAGGTFAIHGLGVKGYPTEPFRINMEKLKTIMA